MFFSIQRRGRGLLRRKGHRTDKKPCLLTGSFSFSFIFKKGSLEGTEKERIINNFKLSLKEEGEKKKSFKCETGLMEGLVLGLSLPSHEVYKCSLQRVCTLKEHSF